jgi:hypothetical protein
MIVFTAFFGRWWIGSGRMHGWFNHGFFLRRRSTHVEVNRDKHLYEWS